MGGRPEPRVSVCIPTYNYGRFLAEALQSVLSQDFVDYELLVIDNNSSDNTREIVASFQDSRIRYLRNRLNIGFVPNSNLCLEQARGQYIKFLHADDVLAAGALREFVAAISGRPHIAVAHSWTEFTDERGAGLGMAPYPAVDREWSGRALIADSLSTNNFIGGHSLVMFRTATARGLGGFNPRLNQLSDWDLWVRLLMRSGGRSLARPLVRYRVHGHAITARTLRANRAACESYLMLNENPALTQFAVDWLYRFYWRVHVRALLDICRHIDTQEYGAALQVIADIRQLDRCLPAYERGGAARVLKELCRLIMKQSTPEELAHYLANQSDALVYRYVFAHGMPLNVEPFEWARFRRFKRVAMVGTGALARVFRSFLLPAGVQVVTCQEPAGDAGARAGACAGAVAGICADLVRQLEANHIEAILTAADSQLANRLIRRELLDRLAGHRLADRVALGIVE